MQIIFSVIYNSKNMERDSGYCVGGQRHNYVRRNIAEKLLSKVDAFKFALVPKLLLLCTSGADLGHCFLSTYLLFRMPLYDRKIGRGGGVNEYIYWT